MLELVAHTLQQLNSLQQLFFFFFCLFFSSGWCAVVVVAPSEESTLQANMNTAGCSSADLVWTVHKSTKGIFLKVKTLSHLIFLSNYQDTDFLSEQTCWIFLPLLLLKWLVVTFSWIFFFLLWSENKSDSKTHKTQPRFF